MDSAAINAFAVRVMDMALIVLRADGRVGEEEYNSDR